MRHPLFAGRHASPCRRRTPVPRLCAGLLLATGGLACAAEADTGAEASRLHLSGFGTLGVVHVDAKPGDGFQRDSFERPNEGGTRADVDTRLGVQANYRVAPQFELVGQVLGANRVASAPKSDVVSLAFAAWRSNDDLTVRAGRMSTDYFLLADYRNVGFAYPFVRPPVENYGGTPYLLDGIDVTKAWRTDESVWKLRGIAGRSRASSALAPDGVVIRPAYALVLSHDDGNGLLVRGSIARVRPNGDTSAARPLIDALNTLGSLPAGEVAARAHDDASVLDYDGRTVMYYSLGANLDRDGWLGYAEVSRYQPKTVGAFTSAWTIVGRRWGAFTAYGGVSAVRTSQDRTPPQWVGTLTPLIGAAAAAQAQQLGDIVARATASSIANQRTWTLGLRWDVSDRIALKLQWDRVRVDAYATRLWTTRTPTEPIDAHVASATIDFVF